MARGRAAGPDAGGGGAIPPLGANPTRVVTAGLSAGIAATLAALPLLHPSALAPWLVGAGAIAAIAAMFSIALGRPEPLPWVLALLGGTYLAAVVGAGTAPGVDAPLVGTGLLAAGELGAWSIDARAGRAERRVNTARATRLSALLVAAATLAAVPLLASSATRASGVWLLFAAAAGVVAALAVVATLAWRVLAAAGAGTLDDRR